MYDWLVGHWPFCLILFLTLIALLVARIQLRRGRDLPQIDDQRLLRRTVLTLVFVMGCSLALATLNMKDHFLAVVGIIISGGLALASTPLLSNVMAGAMLLLEQTFRPGDFLHLDKYSGRVTQMRLLFTELQTEDRDLMRLPSLHLATQPVKVVQASGTIISATVSLGYDTPRPEVERVLEMAALAAELHDPVVQVRELGDYSITYRVAGVLKDVKVLVTARSNLRKLMVDTLHGAGIEIVSPTFTNQRRVAHDVPVIPGDVVSGDGPNDRANEDLGLATAVDHIFFPDAERAGKIIRLTDGLAKAKQEIARLQAKEKEEPGIQMAIHIERKQRHIERMEMILKGLEHSEA